MMRYLLKVAWVGEPLKPVLFTSEKDGSIQHIPLNIGTPLNVKILSKGFCIGTEPDKGEWISCIENKRRLGLEAGEPNRVAQGKQCNLCIKEEYFACRKTCTGKFCNPTSQRAYSLCQPPKTAVYLTRIGSKNKVGVSLQPIRRWVEQGSDFATWVVKLPGLEARAVEQEVAKAFGFNLQVSPKHKMTEAHNSPDFDSTEDLQKAIYSIKQIALEIAEQRKKPALFNENTEFADLRQFYGNLDQIDRPLQEVEIKEGVEFGGNVIAVKGAILIIEKDGYFYGINTKKWSGCSFEFIENATMDTQLSLDDWF